MSEISQLQPRDKRDDGSCYRPSIFCEKLAARGGRKIRVEVLEEDVGWVFATRFEAPSGAPLRKGIRLPISLLPKFIQASVAALLAAIAAKLLGGSSDEGLQ